jgi:hypothetical protein
LCFIPIIGFIIGMVLLFAPGANVVNRYGAPPASGSAATALALE